MTLGAAVTTFESWPLAVRCLAALRTWSGGLERIVLIDDHSSGAPGPLPSDPRLEVRITTLDVALGGRTAAVVKIDVEGAMQSVIEGARGSLREGRIRHLVYEAHEDERDLLASSLRDSGYSIFALGRDRFGLILGGDREAPSLPGYEAPSCLATRDPSRVHAAFRRRGWRVFS